MKQLTLFANARLGYDEAMAMTVDSLLAYSERHDTWCIAWSGGKDSTTLLTVVLHLIAEGLVEKPKRLIVCYADTRMELPPLAHVAKLLIDRLTAEGVEVRVVMAPMDKRYFVYMLGRGVPPPNNNTFRWCTRQIKVDPMQKEIERVVEGEGGNVLMLTGVRQGESAIRDGRIAMSCSRDGAECGQGWYQQMTGRGFATLAPIIHWRVCNVWDWLKIFAPSKRYGQWPTAMLADAYGGEEAEEINARTGCVGCPLAQKDTALDAVIAISSWSHLAPLRELRPLYRELREPKNRLRQPGGEARKDGTLSPNQHRMGPLTIDARKYALAKVLAIQSRCNADSSRPAVDILNTEEVARIEELIALRTFPQKWTGDEALASEPFIEHGQTLLFGL
jgi:DNA sulfur modification protein DndC